MPGALDGIRIIDLSWGIAGPVGVWQLAEQGADVIKVEPPDGDPFRAQPGYTVWNRSRRSVALDLQQEAGRERLLELLATADVLVEAFRPGKMAELGLDYGSLAPRFPRLVYGSVPGYPPGHRAAGRPGYDALVQARSGMQWEQPGWRPGPVFNHLPLPSMAAQFLLQLGVTSALIAREETGRGQHVQTSLYQGALAFTTMLWQWVEHAGNAYHAIMAKSYPPGVHQTTIFECADGEWVHAASMVGLTPTASQDELLGLGEGPDFNELMAMSPEEKAEYDRTVAEAFKEQDRDELVRAYQEHNLGAEGIVPPEEQFDHPQLVANGTVVEVDDPVHGRTTQIGNPLTMERTPPAVQGPQPAVGQHTDEVLAELSSGTGPAGGPEPSAVPGAGSRRRALEGITVLDFGQYLAGPLGPMLLADLGAEVIKVEPVKGDAMRGASKPFVGCQRGKKDVALDLKSDEGLEIAHQLVEQADVVHHNMTKGVAERLGLDGQTLRQRNPDLIYCNTYAYGHEGPLSHFGGLDPLYQAACGLEYEAGAVHTGNAPLYIRFGMSDTANALASAQAVLLAVLHHRRTGEAQSVTTSLLSASAIYSSEFFRTEQGPGPRRPRLDQQLTGTTPTYRLYPTQSGWLQLAAVTDEHWRSLCEAIGQAELSDDARFATAAGRQEHREALEEVLEPAFASRTARTWSLILDDHGVPNEVAVDTNEGELVLFDEDNVRLGLVADYQQPRLGELRQFGQLVEFSDTPGTVWGPPPMHGENTRELLGRLGYDEAAIDDLVARKVVAVPGEEYPWPV